MVVISLHQLFKDKVRTLILLTLCEKKSSTIDDLITTIEKFDLTFSNQMLKIKVSLELEWLRNVGILTFNMKNHQYSIANDMINQSIKQLEKLISQCYEETGFYGVTTNKLFPWAHIEEIKYRSLVVKDLKSLDAFINFLNEVSTPSGKILKYIADSWMKVSVGRAGEAYNLISMVLSFIENDHRFETAHTIQTSQMQADLLITSGYFKDALRKLKQTETRISNLIRNNKEDKNSRLIEQKILDELYLNNVLLKSRALMKNDQPESALNQLKTINLNENINMTLKIRYYILLGDLYYHNFRLFDDARWYYREAIAMLDRLMKEEKNKGLRLMWIPYQQAYLYNEIGTTFLSKGHLGDALNQFQKAKNLFKRTQLQFDVAVSKYNECLTYFLKGEILASLYMIQEVTVTFKTKHTKDHYVRAKSLEAMILAQVGDLGKAKEIFKEVLETCRDKDPESSISLNTQFWVLLRALMFEILVDENEVLAKEIYHELRQLILSSSTKSERKNDLSIMFKLAEFGYKFLITEKFQLQDADIVHYLNELTKYLNASEYFEIRVLAMIYLTKIIEKYVDTLGDFQFLHSTITPLLNDLESHARRTDNYRILLEILRIRAIMAMKFENFRKAMIYIQDARNLADVHGLKRLSVEMDELWEKAFTRFNQVLSISQDVLEIMEVPIAVIISMDTGAWYHGILFEEQHLTELEREFFVNNYLIPALLTGIHTMVQESRVSRKNYFRIIQDNYYQMLSHAIKPSDVSSDETTDLNTDDVIILSYVFKGTSITAERKFRVVVEDFKHSKVLKDLIEKVIKEPAKQELSNIDKNEHPELYKLKENVDTYFTQLLTKKYLPLGLILKLAARSSSREEDVAENGDHHQTMNDLRFFYFDLHAAKKILASMKPDFLHKVASAFSSLSSEIQNTMVSAAVEDLDIVTAECQDFHVILCFAGVTTEAKQHLQQFTERLHEEICPQVYGRDGLVMKALNGKEIFSRLNVMARAFFGFSIVP